MVKEQAIKANEEPTIDDLVKLAEQMLDVDYASQNTTEDCYERGFICGFLHAKGLSL